MYERYFVNKLISGSVATQLHSSLALWDHFKNACQPLCFKFSSQVHYHLSSIVNVILIIRNDYKVKRLSLVFIHYLKNVPIIISYSDLHCWPAGPVGANPTYAHDLWELLCGRNRRNVDGSIPRHARQRAEGSNAAEQFGPALCGHETRHAKDHVHARIRQTDETQFKRT